MASLFTDLTSKPQRETTGSDVAARFDYQKDWALCRMMRKHISGENYLIAFEYHDDVLFLAPSENPTSAEFCQVKTSRATSPRKLSTLTNRPGGKSSILAKMFSNFDGVCSSHDVRVVLVSNNAFEFADGELCATNLDEKFRKRLIAKLQSEIPEFDEQRLEKLHFLVTGVSLEAMQSFLEGEAMELFCQKFGEDHGLNIRTWIRLIKGEIARRNNYPSDKIKNTDELIKEKCIGNPLVEGTLCEMHANARKLLDVGIISQYLMTEGWSSADIMRFRKKFPEATNDFYDPLNNDVKEIADVMRKGIFDESDTPLELGEFTEKSVEKILNRAGVASIYRQKDYLRALGALIYNDAI